MGIGASHQTKLEREFGDLGDGDGEERFFGLENFGNTCYCNSVLQASSSRCGSHSYALWLLCPICVRCDSLVL